MSSAFRDEPHNMFLLYAEGGEGKENGSHRLLPTLPKNIQFKQNELNNCVS